MQAAVARGNRGFWKESRGFPFPGRRLRPIDEIGTPRHLASPGRSLAPCEANEFHAPTTTCEVIFPSRTMPEGRVDPSQTLGNSERGFLLNRPRFVICCPSHCALLNRVKNWIQFAFSSQSRQGGSGEERRSSEIDKGGTFCKDLC
jgi:hypothetical protein